MASKTCSKTIYIIQRDEWTEHPKKTTQMKKKRKKNSKTKSSTLSRKEKENAREHIPNIRQHVPFPLNYFTLHFVSFSKRPKIQRIVTSKRLNISYFLSLHRFASIHYCTLIHFRPTTKIGFDAFAYVTMHQTTCRLLFCCEFISTMQRLSTVCSQFLGCASKRLRMSISVTLLQNSFVEFVMKSEKWLSEKEKLFVMLVRNGARKTGAVSSNSILDSHIFGFIVAIVAIGISYFSRVWAPFMCFTIEQFPFVHCFSHFLILLSMKTRNDSHAQKVYTKSR